MTRERFFDLALHPWLAVRIQIALGVIFVVAALPKLADPPAFAEMIYNYRLVPGGLVNVIALVMPWLEIMTGIALILGIWRRAAAALIGALLAVFIVAMSINLARDHAVGCGCFDVNEARATREQLFTEMKVVVARDVAMLLMVAEILASARRRADDANGRSRLDAERFPLSEERP